MSGSSASVSLEEVKKNIRALLISAPRGLSVDDIEHDYRAMLGKLLPFKHFKCDNCLEFLKTIPDVVCPCWSNGTLILRGIADASTRHIAKLVSRQKPPRSRSRRVYKQPICTKPLVVPSYFRANIKELLSCYPRGILGSAFNGAYSRHYGEEINYAKLGFKSMADLLSRVQDIATIVKDRKGGFRVCAPVKKDTKPLMDTKLKPPPTTQNIRHRSIPSKRQTITNLTSLENDVTVKNERNVEKVKDLLDSKSGVSDELKEDLFSVLGNRPNGIWAARLPFEYKALLKKELSLLPLGFYSVIEMASSLPDVFRIERPFPNGDWLLLPSERSRKDKNMTKIHLPENGIGKGACYCQLSLPETDTVDVFVTHIKTPGCFWVQLVKHSDELVELEKEIREFYESKKSAEFLMSDCLVKIGQVCAARFPDDNLWYRTLITATSTPRMVEVFYVDYGNSSQVSKSNLRLMKKEFIQLPAQALKSKLANIKPKFMGKWDATAAHRLNDLTFNKGLYSIVCETKDEVLSLCICDTTSKVDVHVNDVLVDEGFAVLKQVSVANDRVSPPVVTSVGVAQPITSNSIEQLSPDYSVPYNLYNGLASYGMVPMANIPSPEQLLPAELDENAPVFKEKLSDEDREFISQVCEEFSDGGSNINTSSTVKRLNLPGDKLIHLINFQGKPYVVRPEVSALLWDSDLLRTMLRQKKMVVPKEVIAREDYEELFNELKRQNVGYFNDGDEVKEFASLYELSTIPGILETFEHHSVELLQKVKEEKATFDANPDTYWIETKGEENNSSETDDSCQSEADEELNSEELKLALQALQFRRKRFIRDMMKGELTVDEVVEVEKRISNIHELIAKAEAREKGEDVEDSKDNKDSQGEGATSKKTMNIKEDSVPSTVNREDSAEVKGVQEEQEVKTTNPEDLVSQNPSPIQQPTMTHDKEKPKEKPLSVKQDEMIVTQEHYLNRVQAAQRTINNLTIANTLSKNPKVFTSNTSSGNQRKFVPQKLKDPKVDAKPVNNPSRPPPHVINRVTTPRGLPPFPRSHGNVVPRTSFPFPPPTVNHLLPFPGCLMPLHHPFADLAVPPVGPYHTPGSVGQQPVSPIYLQWGQNPVGSGAMWR